MKKNALINQLALIVLLIMVFIATVFIIKYLAQTKDPNIPDSASASASASEDTTPDKTIKTAETVNSKLTTKVCFSDICINAEVAKTPKDKEIGLMNRDYMPEDSGMLFIFERKAEYPFWMKNTLIPLDMIWVDENLQIVDIQQAIPCVKDPCFSYKPSNKALYVVEVNSGFTKKNSISVGDKISIEEY